jgi:hypothetical protein
MELNEDERRLAAALNVHAVWYQDCFASGSDRDPASIFELLPGRGDAESRAEELRRKAGPESFERYEVTGPHVLLALYDERLSRPETHYLVTEELVRALLARPAK